MNAERRQVNAAANGRQASRADLQRQTAKSPGGLAAQIPIFCYTRSRSTVERASPVTKFVVPVHAVRSPHSSNHSSSRYGRSNLSQSRKAHPSVSVLEPHVPRQVGPPPRCRGRGSQTRDAAARAPKPGLVRVSEHRAAPALVPDSDEHARDTRQNGSEQIRDCWNPVVDKQTRGGTANRSVRPCFSSRQWPLDRIPSSSVSCQGVVACMVSSTPR